jgi:hypothetical protein
MASLLPTKLYLSLTVPHGLGKYCIEIPAFNIEAKARI